MKAQYKQVVFCCIAVLVLLLIMLDLWVGSFDMSGSALLQVLFHPGSAHSMAYQVVWMLRLPHVVAVILVGVALSLAGAVLQGLFRNPLADPGLLGVGAGAQLGVILYWLAATSLGISIPKLLGLPVVAFVGGIITVALLYAIAHRIQHVGMAGILLTGVALSALFAALGSLLVLHLNDLGLRQTLLWSYGGVVQTHWPLIGVCAGCVLLGCFCVLHQSRALDVLMLGEQEAAYAGVCLIRVKRWCIVGVALLVAASVALVGPIAFIGLVVPHMVRIIWGPAHRRLLAYSVILGAGLILLTDIVCRLSWWQQTLPLGIVIAVYGAPLFLWLLLRRSAVC